jgi:hypothetical protein
VRVAIADNVFSASGAFVALDRILDHFLSGRHRWEIDDVDGIQNSPWLAGSDRVSRRNTEILEKCFVAAATASAGRMHVQALAVDMTIAAPNRLSPEDALAYLSSPAIVVVENAESDGAFLDALIYAYDRVELWHALESRWVELDHAGGFGEIEKRLERYLARTQGPPRVLVLADSDRLYPEHESPTFQKIDEVCTKLNVPHVVLDKRAIENYIPVGALQRHNRRDCYQAFLKLDMAQRAHYSMKKGFSRDDSGRPVIPADQATIFRHTPARVLDDLCGGFGADTWQLFKDARDVITADTLTLTCTSSPLELPTLLDRIEALI